MFFTASAADRGAAVSTAPHRLGRLQRLLRLHGTACETAPSVLDAAHSIRRSSSPSELGLGLGELQQHGLRPPLRPPRGQLPLNVTRGWPCRTTLPIDAPSRTTGRRSTRAGRAELARQANGALRLLRDDRVSSGPACSGAPQQRTTATMNTALGGLAAELGSPDQ
jgi:hypothetical protein